jgi:hypothetical protein
VVPDELPYRLQERGGRQFQFYTVLALPLFPYGNESGAVTEGELKFTNKL